MREKLEYYENEFKFNSVFSKNNLPEIKDGTYVINFDKCWILEWSGVEHIPNEIKKFISNKNIATTIYIIQAHNSIMCRYICIRFNDFMLQGKSLLAYTNLTSPKKYLKKCLSKITIFLITEKI